MPGRPYFWSALDQFGRTGVQFAISVVLARLLTPSEYGLMGMVTIFLALSQTFIDGGFGSGLIQRASISSDDETTVFWFNVGSGAVMAALLCAVSPLVGRFFQQPALVPLLCVCAAGVLVGAFGVVQLALLNRMLAFRTLALVGLVAVITSGALGIVAALRGLGVWALVAQSLGNTVVTVVCLWLWGGWRPSGRCRWSSLRSLWPFSSRMLASGLLDAAFENSYGVVIGKYYAPAELGNYARASGFAMLPARVVTSVLARVTLASFSRIQEQKAALQTELRRLVRLVASLHFPAMAGLAAVAEGLVRVLLTEKWLSCVPYMQVLCIAGMLYPVHVLHLNALTAQGRSGLFLRLELVKKGLVVVLLVVTARIGVMAMLKGGVVVSVVCLGINGYYSRRFLGYSWREQACDLVGGVVVASGIAAGLAVARAASPQVASVQLAVQCGAFAVLFGGAVVALRRGVYSESWRWIEHYTRSLRSSNGG